MYFSKKLDIEQQHTNNHTSHTIFHQFIPQFHSTLTTHNSFEDKYTILSQIGEGGQYGKVYRVKRKFDSSVYVAKIIDKRSIHKIKSLELKQLHIDSLKNESNIMKILNHQYIIQLYDTYETQDSLYLIMEECQGGELFDKIAEKQQFTENDAKRIIKMVAEALFYLHSNHIIYRDLKPENILFKNTSDLSNIALIDFGMSKILPPSKYCKQLCGTSYYTAPEVIDSHYSHSADLWSLGVLMFCMIFGYVPFYVDPTAYNGDQLRETYEIYKLIKNGFNHEIKRGYGTWFPETIVKQHSISDECMDLITNLMTKDVTKRLTAKEVLQHHWINGSSIDVDLLGLSLCNFSAGNQFKYVICKLYAKQYKSLRSKYIDDLKCLFDIWSGDERKISYKVFEQHMIECKRLTLNKKQIKSIFDAMDTDSSGYITFEMVLNASIYDYLMSGDKRLYNVFVYFNNMMNERELNDIWSEHYWDLIELNNDENLRYDEFLNAINCNKKNEYECNFAFSNK